MDGLLGGIHVYKKLEPGGGGRLENLPWGNFTFRKVLTFSLESSGKPCSKMKINRFLAILSFTKMKLVPNHH